MVRQLHLAMSTHRDVVLNFSFKMIPSVPFSYYFRFAAFAHIRCFHCFRSRRLPFCTSTLYTHVVFFYYHVFVVDLYGFLKANTDYFDIGLNRSLICADDFFGPILEADIGTILFFSLHLHDKDDTMITNVTQVSL